MRFGYDDLRQTAGSESVSAGRGRTVSSRRRVAGAVIVRKTRAVLSGCAVEAVCRSVSD